MRYFLGVDGGGTKTQAVLVTEDGRLVSGRTGGPTNILENGEEIFKKNMEDILKPLLMKAKGEVISCLGIPAVGEFRDSERIISKIVESTVGLKPSLVVNDVVVGWASGTLGRDGVHIVSGTGAIVYGRHGGKETRVSGWGSIIGDEGSAYHIGVETLRVVSKQLDGRLEKTELCDFVFKKLNFKDHYDFIQWIYDPHSDRRSKIASIAVLTYEMAKKGDKFALEILERASEELACAVIAAAKKLELSDPLVSCSGSVLVKNEVVRKKFEEIVKKNVNAKVVTAKLKPVLGGVILAMKHVLGDIPEAIIGKLEEVNEMI